jgi:hypothetical protein
MINLEIQSSCDEALYQVCLQNNPWSTFFLFKLYCGSFCGHTWYSASLQELCISRLIMDYVMDIPDTVLHHRSSVFQGWSWIILPGMKVQMFSWTGQQPCEFINMSFLLCSWLFHSSNVLVFVSSMGDVMDIPDTVLHHRSSVFQGWSWIILWTYLIQCFITLTGALNFKVDHGLCCRHTWYSASSQELCMKYCIRYVYKIIHDQPWNTELLWWSTVSGMSTT